MKIDYDSARRDAKKLRALAEDCEAAAKTCSKYQNELSLYWQGSAADSYVSGLAQLRKKNQELAKSIEQLSAQITMTVNELEEADRRLAAKIASKRVTGAGSTSKTANYVTAAANRVASAAKDVMTGVQSGSGAKTSAKTNTNTLVQSAFDMVSKLFGKG